MKKGAVCSWNFRGQGGFREDHGSGDCLLLWGSSILFVEKKEGKERGQTNRETGGKTACDSWDPALLLGIPKWKRGQMELTMLDVGQGDVFFFRDGTEKIPDRRRKQFVEQQKVPVGTLFKIPGREEVVMCG